MINFKNIKKITLGLVAGAALGTGAAQAGFQYDGIHFMDGSDFGAQNQVLATDMINSLLEMEIPVLDGGKNGFKVCQPEGDSYTLGYYVPSDNYVVICTNVADKNMQFETLTHEVVHVIQDARTGINNDDLVGPSRAHHKQLVDNLAGHKIDTIVNLYDEEDWVVETEAFFFEDKPAVVAEELRRWAF